MSVAAARNHTVFLTHRSGLTENTVHWFLKCPPVCVFMYCSMYVCFYSGVVYTCGLNDAHQLGIGSAPNSTPKQCLSPTPITVSIAKQCPSLRDHFFSLFIPFSLLLPLCTFSKSLLPSFSVHSSLLPFLFQTPSSPLPPPPSLPLPLPPRLKPCEAVTSKPSVLVATTQPSPLPHMSIHLDRTWGSWATRRPTSLRYCLKW